MQSTENRQADRLHGIPFSDIRKVSERADQLDREGKAVIHMEIGRPDFDTPAHIKRAAVQALDEGFVHYTSNYGILSLRQATADKLRRDNQIQVDPEGELIVTVGANEALSIAMLAFLNPGDQIMVPDPAWINYFHAPLLAGAQVIPYSLRPERCFQPDPDEIEKLITPRTRMLLINSPGNPTGGIIDRETLAAIAELAIARNLLVVSDEIYEKIIYDEAEHVSMASLPGMAERTLTVNGFSKAYAMDGWRLGYVAAARPLIHPMIRVRQYLTTAPTSFAQVGAVAAYRGDQACVEEMRRELDRRRLYLVAALNDIPGLSCVRPRGAFYAFPSIKALGLNSAEVAHLLLEDAHVAVVAGSAFGQHGEGFIRLSYATAYEHIVEAVDRMRTLFGRMAR